MEKIIKTICLEKLADKITEKGVSCEPNIEEILRNLGVLATETTDFGDKKRYIPLNIKEILLNILYPNSRIECKLTHNQENSFWCAEAYVYLSNADEKAKGEGRFAYTLKSYAEENNMAEESAVITIGNWVRGLARTRAIQAALPFLNLYCEEDVPDAMTPELPIPKSQEEKRVENIKKATEKMAEIPSSKEEENSEQIPVEKEKSSMTLEEAFAQVSDVGNCKGHTLGEIYAKQPRNIIWMLNKGGSKLREALFVIIEQDEFLKTYL